MRPGRIVLLLAVATALVAGCGGAAAASPSGVPSAPPTATVDIHYFSFFPHTVRSHAGERVTWINQDPSTHTATAVGGTFATGDIAPGHSATITFDHAGTYAYRCSIHQFMTGSVVVTP